MRVRAIICLLLVAAFVLPACGGDDSSGEEAVRDALEDGSLSPDEIEDIGGSDSSASGSCSVEVTGGFEASWEDDGGIDAAGSDYWSSEKSIEQALEALGGDDVAEGEFALYGLILNCQGDDGNSLSVLTTSEANKDNFPFGPGTYDTAEGVLSLGDDGALISTLVSLGEGADAPVVGSTGGTLDITKFDKSGIKATLTVDLEESFATGTPRTGTLTATFDFDCTGDACG